MDNSIHNPACFARHMGAYAIEPKFMGAAVKAIKDGLWEPKAQAGEGEPGEPFQVTESGIGIIELHGPMFKGASKFGLSMVERRKALRAAVADESVRSILLHVDSPGGTVAGSFELADDVRAANEVKPVVAFIEDLGASAALLVASQAGQVFANRAAEVGSIGVYTVIEDSSGLFNAAGVEVHVITSAPPIKGAFEDGTPATPEQLAAVQENVDDFHTLLVEAIAEGRGLPTEDIEAVADGRVHIAAKALDLNLIDGVQSLDETVAQMGRAAAPRRSDVAREMRRLRD